MRPPTWLGAIALGLLAAAILAWGLGSVREADPPAAVPERLPSILQSSPPVPEYRSHGDPAVVDRVVATSEPSAAMSSIPAVEIAYSASTTDLASYQRLRQMAACSGVELPSSVSGPPDMWTTLTEIDAAYGPTYSRARRSFSERLASLAQKAAVKGMGLVPLPDDQSRGTAFKREDGMRTARIGREDGRYAYTVPVGVDADLDAREQEILSACAAASDAVVRIFAQYNVPMEKR